MKARGDDEVGNPLSRSRGFYSRNVFEDSALRNRNHHHARSLCFPRRVIAGHAEGVAQEQFLQPDWRLPFADPEPQS